MKYLYNGFLGFIFIVLSINVCANDELVLSSQKGDIHKQKKLREPAEFQRVIDQYQKYLSTVSAKVREEIVEYRLSIAKLNKRKKLLYLQLSQEAQQYLTEEQKYKALLPLDRKRLINVNSDKQGPNNKTN